MGTVTSLDDYRKKKTIVSEAEDTLRTLVDVKDGVVDLQSYIVDVLAACDRGEKPMAFRSDNHYVNDMFYNMVKEAYKEVDHQISIIFNLLSTGDPTVYPEMETMEKVFSDFERVFKVMAVNDFLIM